MRKSHLISSGLLAACWASTAFAQPADYTSVEVPAGMQKQVAVNAAFGPNCEPIRLPPIQIITPPKHGVLKVRDGVATGNPNTRCVGQKSPAQVIFVQPNADYRGTDEIVIQVTGTKGNVTTHHIQMTVKDPPPDKDAPKQPARPTEQSL